MAYTFKKEEHLCGKKKIDTLFRNGKNLFIFPYAMRWDFNTDPQVSTSQLLIIVPKRKLHHAVDRNRTKRIIRECYRLQKNELLCFLSEHNIKISLSIMYIATTPPDFHELYQQHNVAVNRLCKHICKYLKDNRQ